jgi:hypothetical protein
LESGDDDRSDDENNSAVSIELEEGEGEGDENLVDTSENAEESDENCV